MQGAGWASGHCGHIPHLMASERVSLRTDPAWNESCHLLHSTQPPLPSGPGKGRQRASRTPNPASPPRALKRRPRWPGQMTYLLARTPGRQHHGHHPTLPRPPGPGAALPRLARSTGTGPRKAQMEQVPPDPLCSFRTSAGRRALSGGVEADGAPAMCRGLMRPADGLCSSAGGRSQDMAASSGWGWRQHEEWPWGPPRSP